MSDAAHSVAPLGWRAFDPLPDAGHPAQAPSQSAAARAERADAQSSKLGRSFDWATIISSAFLARGVDAKFGSERGDPSQHAWQRCESGFRRCGTSNTSTRKRHTHHASPLRHTTSPAPPNPQPSAARRALRDLHAVSRCARRDGRPRIEARTTSPAPPNPQPSPARHIRCAGDPWQQRQVRVAFQRHGSSSDHPVSRRFAPPPRLCLLVSKMLKVLSRLV